MTDEAGSVSQEDVKALRDELANLRGAYDELKAASTPKEEKEAREEIAEVKADLDALAKDAGLPRATLEKAIAAARDDEDYGKFKRQMDRYVSELPDDEEEKPEDAKDEEGEKEPKPAKEPKPDSEPVVEHWSERRVTEILR